MAARAPFLRPVLTRPGVWVAWLFWPALRRDTRANARRLLGPGATARARDRLARRVVRRFADSVLDLARSPSNALERVSAIEGTERYLARRRDAGTPTGVVLVTAHLGGFEPALAAMRQVEARVYVGFRRDGVGSFERARARFRESLGVIEAPLDEGLPAWLRLRDALTHERAAVLLQGDRVMAGQRGIEVPFFSGNIRVPTGPFRLAQAAGAPVVPVFAPYDPRGRVRIILGEALAGDDPEASARAYARALEQLVRRYPDQWLMVVRAWVEDRGG